MAGGAIRRRVFGLQAPDKAVPIIYGFRNGISRLYPNAAGCIFLALGIVTLIQPEILYYYTINLDQPSARTAVRAMIGGGEIGIALVLLFGGYVQMSHGQRSFIAAIIFISVGLSRLVGVWIEGLDFATIQPLREAAIELVLGGAGLWAASNWKASEVR